MTRRLNHPQVKPLLSDEHFSVDGTLIEAWASQRSFRPKDGSVEGGSNFDVQTRKNDTHQSTTDSRQQIASQGGGSQAPIGAHPKQGVQRERVSFWAPKNGTDLFLQR